MNVLIACEHSGVVREAFRLRSHEAMSCDLLPASDGSSHHLQMDVMKALYQYDWDMVIAHPPCTYLCVTGNRHYANDPKRLEAVRFVEAIMTAPYDKICVENPVGVLSTVYRKPDQYIHPYMFGDKVKKKTGLWLKGLPLLQPTNTVTPDEDVVFTSGKRMNKWYYETSLLPPKERGHVRSITFQGIADAMASQWG